MKKKLIVSICLIVFNIQAHFERKHLDQPGEPEGQIRKGNLALVNSQQPGPLFSFGQNVVDKGDFQLFGYVDYLQGKCRERKYNDVAPALLYAFNNHSSVYIAAPFATQSTFNGEEMNGIENLLVQFEFDLYVQDHLTATDEITFIIAGLLPIGSPFMNPPTGFSSPSVFIGTTASHLSIDWYFFTSFAALMPFPRNDIKYGDAFFYDFGIGRNIVGDSQGCIVSVLLEFNGLYQAHDTYGGLNNPNSGGNVIYLGPSLWLSTERLIIQAGIEYALYEKLNGTQPLRQFFASITAGWKFN